MREQVKLKQNFLPKGRVTCLTRMMTMPADSIHGDSTGPAKGVFRKSEKERSRCMCFNEATIHL